MNKKIFLATPFALISLLTGILGGLARAGWNFDFDEVSISHGGIMVGGFLGTVISLERAAVLKKIWYYLVPFSSGISLVFFLFGYTQLAFIALIIASLGLIVMYSIMIHRFREKYLMIMMLGAIAWLTGNIYMAKIPAYPMAVGWWILFILLTILGERLELSKFLPEREFKTKTIWVLIASILAISILQLDHLYYGIVIMLIGLWLVRYDVAMKSARKDGINGYVGVLLLTGYGWLVITGLLQIVPARGFTYDAVLHSFFIGFAFTMIFAHGPLIFPGVAGLNIKPYHPVLYVWFGVLQISMITRLFSDIMVATELRKISSMGNGVAILGFFITLMILTKRGSRSLSSSKPV